MSNYQNSLNSRLLSVVLLFILIVCLGACAPKHTSYSDICNIPDAGWAEGAPLNFTPQYGDSSTTYDITLAVRHSTRYDFNNLCLTVDFIGSQSQVHRKKVKLDIADEFGNWKGGGFGDYYQCGMVVATNVHPDDVSRIIVWPAMNGCKLLKGLLNMEVIVSPSK